MKRVLPEYLYYFSVPSNLDRQPEVEALRVALTSGCGSGKRAAEKLQSMWDISMRIIYILFDLCTTCYRQTNVLAAYVLCDGSAMNLDDIVDWIVSRSVIGAPPDGYRNTVHDLLGKILSAGILSETTNGSGVYCCPLWQRSQSFLSGAMNDKKLEDGAWRVYKSKLDHDPTTRDENAYRAMYRCKKAGLVRGKAQESLLARWAHDAASDTPGDILTLDSWREYLYNYQIKTDIVGPIVPPMPVCGIDVLADDFCDEE